MPPIRGIPYIVHPHPFKAINIYCCPANEVLQQSTLSYVMHNAFVPANIRLKNMMIKMYSVLGTIVHNAKYNYTQH